MWRRRFGRIIGIGILTGQAGVTVHIGRELQAGEENESMTRKRLMLVTLVAMLIALGAMGIRAKSVAAASGQVPFIAFYSGTAVLTSPTTATFSGKGIATHLGSSTNEASIVVTGPYSSCPGGLASDHYETLTAANGDTLMLISYDNACPTSPGIFDGIGHWVVTGGTGRFRAASGQGIFHGYSDFNQGVFNIQLTGTIRTPSQH
jgi:hypothetical protein